MSHCDERETIKSAQCNGGAVSPLLPLPWRCWRKHSVD